MSPASLQFCPFDNSHAEEMLSWRYPAPYELYNSPGPKSQKAIEDLLREEMPYFAVLDEQGEMIAFRCYGREAQVPGGDYAKPALDMGGGLRPDLTGKGLGRHIIAAAMNYGLQRFSPCFFRATVASFNVRARKTCESVGYRLVRSFTRAADGRPFDILMQEARMTSLSIPMREKAE
jgi:RimJ/RimL family protein N-acetyltransferase